MNRPASVLAVDDLKTYFRTGAGIARAVDGVSFRIADGETYALVGESGSGKSVTALSILRLLPQPAGFIAGGRIRLRDRDLLGLTPAEMRTVRGKRISMIFQEPMTALNPVFSIGSQVRETLLVHEELSRAAAKEKAIALLDEVGLPDAPARFNEYPHQLSGGMRQRVMIAMALACEPELLIADEPTTALDVTIQFQILELIRALQRRRSTAVMLITHNMGIVRENADRVGVMYGGRIVEEAPRERLFETPAHPYTQLLLQSLPAHTGRGKPLATIRGIVPKATDFPEGCRFSNRCPAAMPRCRREVPPPYPVGDGHAAACFLLDAAARDGAPAAIVRADMAPAAEPAAADAAERLRTDDLKMHFPIRKGLLRRPAGWVRAVDGVSLRVRKGETLALVGESGCGKTTVGKCLVRLLDPTAGSIVFEGEPVDRGAAKRFRRRIQMIFQDPFSSLNPRLMIGESVAEGMLTHGLAATRAERETRVADVLGKVGLDPAMSTRYPHEFSGGQRQRIGIARALAVEPELIICDEVTSSLDVSVQAQILNLLRKLQAELGLSYLFITHDLSVVRYLADRVSVMYLGRIVEEGTNREVFETPRHPYTRALLAAVPSVDPQTGRKRIVLGGDVPSSVRPPSGCHFHPRCPEARPECADAYPEAIALSDTHCCRCILCRE